MELTDINRTFHPKAAENTFFSRTHGTFSRIDHMLGTKEVSTNSRKPTFYQASFPTTMV